MRTIEEGISKLLSTQPYDYYQGVSAKDVENETPKTVFHEATMRYKKFRNP